MPDLRTYNLFISHAWDYNDEYYRLRDMLNNAPRFDWKDYSVPVHDPEDGSLRQAFIDQIRPVHCFVVTSGMYVPYSKWMLSEIRIAKGMKKPILAVVPQGNERIPQAIQNVADDTVGWSTQSIVDAIRQLAL